MKKWIVGFGVILILAVGFYLFRTFAVKSHSPEGTADYVDGNTKIHVFYNRPFKKGRDIFGGLVPYNKTWRTGANEATQFVTNVDLKFGDKELKAGKYSLWTVPGEQTWQVILNKEIPMWGVNFKGEANRDPANDAVVVEVPSVKHDKEFEQFTISIEKAGDSIELIFFWDTTLVAVPFTVK
jgi:hypothetical protein